MSSAGTSSNGIDEHEAFNALGSVEREVHRDRRTDIDANDRSSAESQRRERTVEVVGLCRDAVLSVERTIGFAIAEEVDRERSPAGHREQGANAPPQEAAGAESVDEQDRCTAMSITFDVHGPWPHRNA